MSRLATYFVAGLIFAVGLVIGGMTQPQKIIGFLDITGDWDPSLAYVMLGAVGVHSVSYRLTVRRSAPLFAERFLVPKRHDIDAALIGGALLFGMGWGLGGYCPGPALVATGARMPDAALFLGATVVGHWLFGKYSSWQQRHSAQQAAQRVKPSAAQDTSP